MDDSIDYQRMKNITGIGTENPSQMGQAHAAETYSPAVTRKPGKLIRGCAGIAATDNITKTADLENNPVRVGKRVLVRTLNGNTLHRPGNRLTALAAEYIFLLLR